jgi:putative peptidoglycan lipid II flippase
MVMILISRIFGLIRLRTLAHFYVDEELSLFFAAFRLPDLIFEVFTLGALSSAFIPVFTKSIKKDQAEAWASVSRVVNIGLIIFAVLAAVFSIFASQIYSLIAPGFSAGQTTQIAGLARLLFAAQGVFVISYILTGVLESMRRFLIPALAPIFYNLGIILGIILFNSRLGLYAAVVGVLIGASLHLLIQLPLAYKLGFRFSFSLRPDAKVKKIGKLAAPRILELAFLQVSKVTELFFASTISIASYAHYNLAYSAQTIPVSLFGVSLAKAALPTLSSLDDNPKEFKRTFLMSLYQVIFLTLPLATVLIVLRIPIVRLLFGTDIFNWAATVQTGVILSTFAIGIPFQAATVLHARAFYALHDTRTPVKVSIIGTLLTVTTSIILVKFMGYETWALALAYSLGSAFQAIMLFMLISKKLNGGKLLSFTPILKTIISSFLTGTVMFFILKFFDRAVWVKRLSFFIDINAVQNLNFENFVIDTRYTANLLVLTLATSLIGAIVYLLSSALLRSNELAAIFKIIKTRSFAALPKKETESLIPSASDTDKG